MCFFIISFSNVFHVEFVQHLILMMPVLNWLRVLEIINPHHVELLVEKNNTCYFWESWVAFLYYSWVYNYTINKPVIENDVFDLDVQQMNMSQHVYLVHSLIER
jgi:hypothetical protein